ncbi:putative dynein attachment factor [Chloropicon primus]|uniref:Putative dynein attachment factor n=1 Tax=Chloropicon primus TaxID=1764295 RepID=A0A5B8MGC9_9CHLO|nr:putative dynein attachment factor [Chloropicon primus]UPQ97603.1 putative dynein attachment factor [Chloropicon primus]|eukprot:QDZ18392.1 putative dynein attachment factor [Chloropicon primus]
MASVPKLSKELDNAIEDDRRYKQVDSAKKRAVAQRVDYDTFKNLVSVAHLKPLQAPDEIVRVKGAPAWRFNSSGVTEGKGKGERPIPQEEGSFIPAEQPNTSASFERTWKKSCRTSEERYAYIKFCALDTLAQIFKVELNSALLSSILEVMHEQFLVKDSREKADQVCDILVCLAKSGRFSLTIRLLGKKHKQCLTEIMDQLKQACEKGEDARLEEICKAYGLE